MRHSTAVFLSLLAGCCLVAEHEAVAQGAGTVVVVENPEAMVYAYGHRLTSPFVLEVASDTLWLNGYPVSPVVRFRPPHPWTTPPTPPPEAEEFCRVWGIMLGLANKARTQDSVLVAQGLPYEEVKKRSTEFWLSHELVDTAYVRSTGVAVHYKCETCTVGPYLPFFHTVRRDWTRIKWPTVRECLIRELGRFRRNIEAGEALLIGDGYNKMVGGEIRAAIEQIWRTRAPDTLWAPSVWGRSDSTALEDLLHPRPIIPRGGEGR